jgi:hypothetical protein
VTFAADVADSDDIRGAFVFLCSVAQEVATAGAGFHLNPSAFAFSKFFEKLFSDLATSSFGLVGLCIRSGKA